MASSDVQDDADDFVVAPGDRTFPTALERIQGDMGFLKANIICENVDDGMVAELANALTRNSTLESLSLYLNKVTDMGCVALVEGIANNMMSGTALTHLNLGANRITDEGAQALATLLTMNDTLLKVVIDRNRITQNGVRAIAMALERNTTLNTLSFAQNSSLGDEGARVLGKALHFNSSLRTLNLEDCGVSDDGMSGIAAGLGENKGLQQLAVCHNRVGKEGAKALAAALHHNRSLRTLRITHNDITDAGIVGKGSLGDMMAQKFMKMEQLFLQGNPISEAAGRRLTKELHRRNKGFKTLHFTVKPDTSLAQRERVLQERERAAHARGHIHGRFDDGRSVDEKLDEAVNRLKHPSKTVRQMAARNFLSLLRWSEQERGHAVEKMQRERAVLQAALEAKDAQVKQVDDEKEEAHAEYEKQRKVVQKLVDDNEFVSMGLIHAKQTAEQAFEAKKQQLALLYEDREEAQQQVRAKDDEIMALTHGSEVQLKAPDKGGPGALLCIVKDDEASETLASEHLLLDFTVQGMTREEFFNAHRVHDSIERAVSDEMVLAKELVTLDPDSIVEDSEKKSRRKAAGDDSGSNTDEGIPGNIRPVCFRIVVQLEPGDRTVLLKDRFAKMLKDHAKAMSKAKGPRAQSYLMTDAMKFAGRLEALAVENARLDDTPFRLDLRAQSVESSTAFREWPRKDLRERLQKEWPQLVIEFLDPEFADDHDSDFAVLRDEWPAEQQLLNDWSAEEAAWALAELVRGNADCQEEAVAQGGIDILIAQLMMGSDWMKAAAASALGALAVGHERNRKLIVKANGIVILTALLCIATPRMRESVLKALYVLVPAPKFVGYDSDTLYCVKGEEIVHNKPHIEGGAVVKFSGELPAGLVLNSRTGVISGTPTKVSAKKRYPVTAMNYRGESVFKIEITVIDIAPQLVGYSEAPATYEMHTRIEVNRPILAPEGGSVVAYSGSVPPGLVLNQATGTITGQPRNIQEATTYKIRAVNSGGKSEFDLVISVIDAVPRFWGTGYSEEEAHYIVGEVISANKPKVKGAGTLHFEASPPLPPGLSLDSHSGIIIGNPEQKCALKTYKITVENSGGVAHFEMQIQVHENQMQQMLALAEKKRLTAAASDK